MLAALAVLVGLRAVSPEPEPTVPVLVAAHDLAAGSTLAVDDLRVARYPTALVPSRSLDSSADAVGRVVAAAVSAGSPMTANSTVSTQLSPGRGELLVPLHLADASVLALVRVGDLVTVVTTGDDQQVVTLASRVRVVALPQPHSSGSVVASSGTDAGMVVVAADRTTAARLAAVGSTQQLGLALG